MVPASDEIELEHQPPIGLSAPIPGESPLTPIEDQDHIPIEDALVQSAEKQKSPEIAPPAKDDVVMDRQVRKASGQSVSQLKLTSEVGALLSCSCGKDFCQTLSLCPSAVYSIEKELRPLKNTPF